MDYSILLSSSSSAVATKTHETTKSRTLPALPSIVRSFCLESSASIPLETGLFQHQLTPIASPHLSLIFDMEPDSPVLAQIAEGSPFFSAKAFALQYRFAVAFLVEHTQSFVAQSPSFVLVQNGLEVSIFTQVASVVAEARAFTAEGFPGLISDDAGCLTVSRAFAEHFLARNAFFGAVAGLFSSETFPFAQFYCGTLGTRRRSNGVFTVEVEGAVLGTVAERFLRGLTAPYQADFDTFPSITHDAIQRVRHENGEYECTKRLSDFVV
eukprot:EST44099.1 Hypothetical protein SS50377_16098 [Spironucleus salmonicida]